jgi:hypothetical protein
MRQNIRIVWTAATLGLAACGRQGSMDDQLKKDLEAASVSTMELAPNGGGVRVVSDVEQIRPGRPAPTPPKPIPTPSKTPRPPQTAEQSVSGPAASIPSRQTQTPAVNPAPPGGYKTINEVLRNAPFPIKP